MLRLKLLPPVGGHCRLGVWVFGVTAAPSCGLDDSYPLRDLRPLCAYVLLFVKASLSECLQTLGQCSINMKHILGCNTMRTLLRCCNTRMPTVKRSGYVLSITTWWLHETDSLHWMLLDLDDKLLKPLSVAWLPMQCCPSTAASFRYSLRNRHSSDTPTCHFLPQISERKWMDGWWISTVPISKPLTDKTDVFHQTEAAVFSIGWTTGLLYQVEFSYIKLVAASGCCRSNVKILA